MAGCTFSDRSLKRSSFRGSVHNLVVLWYTVQILVMPCVPARTRVLSFSLNSHSHLHWDQQPEFGEGFLGWRVPNFYLTTQTSGSNETLLNAWLRPNLFISWALLALTTSLGTLPRSVWSFRHMLVNNIQGFIWTWSTCLSKVIPSVTTSCICERSLGTGSPCIQGCKPLQNCSVQGDFSSGADKPMGSVSPLEEGFCFSGGKISSSLVLLAKKRLHFT